MKAYGGVDVYIHIFLTSALAGDMTVRVRLKKKERENSSHQRQEPWRHDDLTCGKPPVVKQL
jgi:hypothetical protein